MCCLDSSPVEGHPHYVHQEKEWETKMCTACCSDPCGCFCACLFPHCYACHIRGMALEGDFTQYRCCQGYYCTQCCGEEFGTSCPRCCLCLEVTLCFPLAISATRLFVQEQRQIRTDPCDNRIIRCNNCLQFLACMCDCLSMCFKPLKECKELLNCVGHFVFISASACMQSQTRYELKKHPNFVYSVIDQISSTAPPRSHTDTRSRPVYVKLPADSQQFLDTGTLEPVVQQPLPVVPMQTPRFCTKCGAQRGKTPFCTKCGNRH